VTTRNFVHVRRNFPRTVIPTPLLWKICNFAHVDQTSAKPGDRPVRRQFFNLICTFYALLPPQISCNIFSLVRQHGFCDGETVCRYGLAHYTVCTILRIVYVKFMLVWLRVSKQPGAATCMLTHLFGTILSFQQRFKDVTDFKARCFNVM